ncbi:MAG: ribonuclease HII [Candidatus Hecatellales archaeon]|nr:MAG: ribonuclease HII [Candidatus Hecatellales archaeon]
MLAVGVDDAGRGSIIGPLVLAGVLHPEDKMEELKELGVKDSKRLTPTRRAKLAELIKSSVKAYHVVEIPPSEIDEKVGSGVKFRRLNFLEAKAAAEIIARLRPRVAYLDSCDVDAGRFAWQVSSLLPFKVKIVSEHGADAKYPIVAAASILAKVHRDQVIARLREAYGDFGSGYPSDPKTRSFLESWFKAHGSYPAFVRRTWKTLRRIPGRAGLNV